MTNRLKCMYLLIEPVLQLYTNKKIKNYLTILYRLFLKNQSIMSQIGY